MTINQEPNKWTNIEPMVDISSLDCWIKKESPLYQAWGNEYLTLKLLKKPTGKGFNAKMVVKLPKAIVNAPNADKMQLLKMFNADRIEKVQWKCLNPNFAPTHWFIQKGDVMTFRLTYYLMVKAPRETHITPESDEKTNEKTA